MINLVTTWGVTDFNSRQLAMAFKTNAIANQQPNEMTPK